MTVPRVKVDEDVCMGTASCVSLAPNTFAIGEAGVALVVDAAGDPLDAVREAEENCPTEAITVEADG